MVNFNQRASADGAVSGSLKTPGVNVGGYGASGEIGLKGNIGTEHMRSSESSTRHGIGRSIDITAEEAKRFSEDLHKVEEYSRTSHAETGHSAAESHLSQLSTDLRDARTASEQYSVHKSESERFSSAASYVNQHSGQIDSDLGQEIANYVVERDGRTEAERLFAGKDRAKLEATAKDYIRASGIENDIISKYQQSGSTINPEQTYRSGQMAIEGKKAEVGIDYAGRSKAIEAKELGFDQQKFNQIRAVSKSNFAKHENDLESIGNNSIDKYGKVKDEVAENIKDGDQTAHQSAFNLKPGAIKPNFLKSNKNKK